MKYMRYLVTIYTIKCYIFILHRNDKVRNFTSKVVFIQGGTFLHDTLVRYTVKCYLILYIDRIRVHKADNNFRHTLLKYKLSRYTKGHRLLNSVNRSGALWTRLD